MHFIFVTQDTTKRSYYDIKNQYSANTDQNNTKGQAGAAPFKYRYRVCRAALQTNERRRGRRDPRARHWHSVLHSFGPISWLRSFIVYAALTIWTPTTTESNNRQGAHQTFYQYFRQAAAVISGVKGKPSDIDRVFGWKVSGTKKRHHQWRAVSPGQKPERFFFITQYASHGWSVYFRPISGGNERRFNTNKVSERRQRQGMCLFAPLNDKIYIHV